MSNFANCVRCGKLFTRISYALCQECIKSDRVDFGEVKSYLRFNPGATIDQTVEDTGISAERIVHWIQMGNLILGPESNINYPCDGGCGTLIRNGRYCRTCVSELSDAFRPLGHKPNVQQRGFLSKD